MFELQPGIGKTVAETRPVVQRRITVFDTPTMPLWAILQLDYNQDPELRMGLDQNEDKPVVRDVKLDEAEAEAECARLSAEEGFNELCSDSGGNDYNIGRSFSVKQLMAQLCVVEEVTSKE